MHILTHPHKYKMITLRRGLPRLLFDLDERTCASLFFLEVDSTKALDTLGVNDYNIMSLTIMSHNATYIVAWKKVAIPNSCD